MCRGRDVCRGGDGDKVGMIGGGDLKRGEGQSTHHVITAAILFNYHMTFGTL